MITPMEKPQDRVEKTRNKSRRINYGDGLYRYERPGGSSSWIGRI